MRTIEELSVPDREDVMASEEPQLYADRIEPVRRTSPEELFLVTLEAVPEADSEDFGELGGAFVNCWVDVDDLRTAELRAVELIQGQHWRPVRFESWSIVSRATYADQEPEDEDEPDYLELVEAAFAQGAAYIFNTWPAGSPDEDTAY
jgi:hypothetical protein